MRILGLDPGTATIGFGVLERLSPTRCSLVSCGCIRTAPGRPLGPRLVEIRQDLLALIDRYRPDSAAIETLFFNVNVRTATTVCQTRGVLLLALAERGIAVDEYGPSEVKKAVAGYGRATKPQIQAMVARILGLARAPSPDDVADAVAIALCHHFSAGPARSGSMAQKKESRGSAGPR